MSLALCSVALLDDPGWMAVPCVTKWETESSSIVLLTKMKMDCWKYSGILLSGDITFCIFMGNKIPKHLMGLGEAEKKNPSCVGSSWNFPISVMI